MTLRGTDGGATERHGEEVGLEREPSMVGKDLTLTDQERQWNEQPLATDRITVYDPDFSLSGMTSGFRIFAFEESLNVIPAKRYTILGDEPQLTTAFLHAKIFHPGEFQPVIDASHFGT